ncbi:MAG: hypothetical protein CM15mP62_10370 [Rhodospirillaceae bacterium]|nr:MAG: hypothetical protein CM15mP62_10370 [Rhodospirillaceae bacterium]
MPEPGLPESFNVLMHAELKGLGLDVIRRISTVKCLSTRVLRQIIFSIYVL